MQEGESRIETPTFTGIVFLRTLEKKTGDLFKLKSLFINRENMEKESFI